MFLIYCFICNFLECFGLFGAFVVTAYSFVGRFFTVVERGQCSEMQSSHVKSVLPKSSPLASLCGGGRYF